MRKRLIWSVLILAAVGATLSRGDEQPPKAVAGKESPKELTLDLGGGVKLEMVLVPPGEFTMGDNENKPARKVRITRPFYLGKYEVTQAQWEGVMGNNPSRFKGARNPVEQVSWDDCQRFIEKLKTKSGSQAGRFALPTEAQWDYASLAGSGAKYCFGSDKTGLGEYGWFEGNSDSSSPIRTVLFVATIYK